MKLRKGDNGRKKKVCIMLKIFNINIVGKCEY